MEAMFGQMIRDMAPGIRKANGYIITSSSEAKLIFRAVGSDDLKSLTPVLESPPWCELRAGLVSN